MPCLISHTPGAVLEECRRSSSPGDEPRDVMATFLQQLGGMGPHQHGLLVLPDQLCCSLLLCYGQASALTFVMKDFQATAGLGRESLPGGLPEPVVVEGLEI